MQEKQSKILRLTRTSAGRLEVNASGSSSSSSSSSTRRREARSCTDGRNLTNLDGSTPSVAHGDQSSSRCRRGGRARPAEAERLRHLNKHVSGSHRREPWPATKRREQASRLPASASPCARPLDLDDSIRQRSELEDENVSCDDALRNLDRRSPIGQWLATQGPDGI